MSIVSRVSVLVVVAAACGGPPEPKFPTPVDAENQIRALEGEILQVVAKRDAAALRLLLDDHFVVTVGGNAAVDKAKFIADITGDDGRGGVVGGAAPTQTLSDEQIKVDGDLGVSTGIVTVAMAGFSKQFRFTATYVYRDGHWRAFAEQVAPIEAAPPVAQPPVAPPAAVDAK